MSSKISPEDLLAIVKAVEEAYKPILRNEIAVAVAEIPFRIREQCETILSTELRLHVRKRLENSLNVTVQVKDVV